jgi:hypothetical protein
LTLALVITAYYLIHDVTPRDVSEISYGWFAAAAVIALAGGSMLLVAPVWQVWPAPWAWVGRALGSVIGAVLVVTALLRRSPSSDENGPEPYRIALVPWYLLGLAVALPFATAGGIWLATVMSLTVWALTIAGLTELRAPPCSLASASVIAVVVVVAAVGSIVTV